jgi:hypothetical protein
MKPGDRISIAGRVLSERSGFVTLELDDGSRIVAWRSYVTPCVESADVVDSTHERS